MRRVHRLQTHRHIERQCDAVARAPSAADLIETPRLNRCLKRATIDAHPRARASPGWNTQRNGEGFLGRRIDGDLYFTRQWITRGLAQRDDAPVPPPSQLRGRI